MIAVNSCLFCIFLLLGLYEPQEVRSDAGQRPFIPIPAMLDTVKPASGSHLPAGRIITSTELAVGVHYHHIITERGHHSVRIVEIDRTAGGQIRVFKALHRADGLEQVSEMAVRLEQAAPNTLKCLVNANLWSALGDTPIGPTVVDGEVVEMLSRKQWSSCFIDHAGAMTIDRFRLQGSIKLPSGVSLAIDNVNHRAQNEHGVVLYNCFAGGAVPESDDDSRERDNGNGTVAQTKDSSDIQVNNDDLKTFKAIKHRAAAEEFESLKILATYAKHPAINELVPCKVLAVTTGVVAVPQNGIVISMGSLAMRHVQTSVLPKAGQMIGLRFATNIHTQTRFTQAVCGVPRLVRSGVAVHEADIEGVTSKRFVEFQLPRTAIGTDVSGKKCFLVVLDGRESDTNAATLQELADVMRSLGAHDALNLDGGGSSSMFVLGKHGAHIGGLPSGRKVSVMLGVTIGTALRTTESATSPQRNKQPASASQIK
jgi:predicted SnoaL-like aldol condensation-catalyzing enzyme